MVENSTLAKLMGAFVCLILGISLIMTISTTTAGVTGLAYSNNESFTIVRGQTDVNDVNTAVQYNLTHQNIGVSSWKNDPSNVPECAISHFVFYNQTGKAVPASSYVLNTATGYFTLNNVNPLNNSVGNSSSVSYNYCPDNYVTGGFGQNAINLVPGLFSLALMAVSLGLFYSVYQDTLG